MAMFPITSTTGDPVFRSQNSALNALKAFSRGAADASQKLNNQERIVNPGDDVLAFNVSRRMRSDMAALRTVMETGQLQVSGLGLAIEGLNSIKTQLDQIKKNLVQSQAADSSERALIQGQIDLALQQIDSTASNTKLGSRSLLNGDSTIQAYRSIAGTGELTAFSQQTGQNLNAISGVQGVRVNQLGTGGPVRTLDDGRTVLSLRVSIALANKATRAEMTIGGGAAGQFSEFRITGKLGSAVLRLDGDWTGQLSTVAGQAGAFNQLAAETGVVITAQNPDGSGNIRLTTVGLGSDEFIRVEKLNSSAAGGATLGGIAAGTAGIGAVSTQFGQAATASVNGQQVEMGGEFGSTIRYNKSGFDIEIDLNQRGLTAAGNSGPHTINVDLSAGTTGLLGASGRSGDQVGYGFGTFTTGTLGRGTTARTTVAVNNNATDAEQNFTNAFETLIGGKVLGNNTVGDIASGGRLSLESGNTLAALQTMDRAINQVIEEQTRLGAMQSAFIGAVGRAETQIGNLTSADADIIGVDAATEITNLIQAQLGISTASSVLSQANAIQANIFSLLRG